MFYQIKTVSQTQGETARGKPSRWVGAYLGLGSNLGDREQNILAAASKLQAHAAVRVLERSRVYQTSPLGPSQEKFLNCALKIKTQLSARQLLTLCKRVESGLKRKKTIKWGPRTIDVDILFYGEIRCDTPKLTLPHPEFAKRKFVLLPLRELCPDFIAPGYEKSVRQLARDLKARDQSARVWKRH